MLIELTDRSYRQFIATHHGRNKIPKPITIRRPWQVDEPPRLASQSEIESFFGSALKKV